MKNLSMGTKLGLGFGTILMLVCLLGYTAYSSLLMVSGGITTIVEKNNVASDMSSDLLDYFRQLRASIRAYESLEQEDDLKDTEKQIAAFENLFAKTKTFSEANPDLKEFAAAVAKLNTSFTTYKDGIRKTIVLLKNNQIVAAEMLKDALTAEKALETLLNDAVKVYDETFREGKSANLGAFAANMQRMSGICVRFKEIRRLYAVAFSTNNTDTKAATDKLFVEIYALIEEIKTALTSDIGRKNTETVVTLLKNYQAGLDKVYQGWSGVNAVTAMRAKAGNDLADTLTTLTAQIGDTSAAFGKHLVNETHGITKRVLFITAGMLLIGILLAVLLTRAITGPLRKGMSFAQSVAAGNLNDHLDIVSRDEIGRLADALRAMVSSLKEKILEANEKSEQARIKGDEATVAMEAAKKAQAAAEAAKRDGMLAAAGQLEGVIEHISSASTQLAAQIEESERGSGRQASRVAETATAMEEMNSTVLEVARNAGSAADLSSQTKAKAEQGALVVQEAVASIQKVQNQSVALRTDMEALTSHAQAINQIMSVISDIADQTNLLALNAAIEAARAGEAGRGFAVVADEVRKLAEKTMASTTDVGNAIKAIQHSADKNREQVNLTVSTIEGATRLIVESGSALSEIVKMMDSTADQVRAIATASEEQSATSEEINHSLAEVNSIASESASTMQEAASAVSDLAHQAQNLARLVEDMKRL